ncbi:MAG: AAA family ATPase, partial [Kiritimatiellae bacterium]|nr:AAA family ATPase [Kiritimatiellia bacterium]
EKRQLICKSGLLELIEPGVADVGGLKKLCDFVECNKDVFKKPGLAREYGVDMPAGVMLVGMPGCGKSLMAKSISKKLEVSLLRLDVGRLMGKYVGESENNLHRAVAVAEAVAPCVLWIDEIEKAFSGIGDGEGGGSVMTRMFGIFLTWMQEKTAPVYVVATANNIDMLPPEFLRRGRFDELFFVDFPNEKERFEILRTHVNRRIRETLSDDDLRKVAACFRDKDCYSGADIESVVKDAMKSWFSQNMRDYGPYKKMWKAFDTGILMAAAKKSSSSYNSQKDKLDKMRERLKKLAKPAN